MGKTAATLLTVSLAVGLCALIPCIAATGQRPTTQQATLDTDRPRAATPKELSGILRHQECDATVRAGEFLRVVVPIPSNDRKALSALFVVFPWGGDKSGVAKVKGVIKNWNRPMDIAWSNEHWVLVADSPPRGADEHLLGLTGWIIGSLRKYRPRAESKPGHEAGSRPAASQPRKERPTSQPAPPENDGLHAELVFERDTREFSLNDEVAVELRLVNKSRVKQKYVGGFGMTNAKYGCQFQVVTAAGARWSCNAPPDAKWLNYDDIILEPGQSLTIGKWNLLDQRCSSGYPARTGKAVQLKDALKTGAYYVRWWDGNFQIRTPLYSQFVKIEITKAEETRRPVQR